ncbi:pyridoxamine 5'-phosphate oxidase family protein [Spongiibacter tropicus]|uniref:pyridoxamine 5'-phosphate oxidase family protein n=1 Tax=Spongiibacter tropicus TaxID=454602 RepID=UPI0024E23B90|nr:pyridoxamine 5'-phosphate oxidase family protein [Spongiibacter tropicus]
MSFHQGELHIQSQLGVREKVAAWACRAIRSHMPDQHREMFATLPFMVVAGQDAERQLWATLLTGEPGFVQSPGPTRLCIHSQPTPEDALFGSFQRGAAIGLLGIDLASRRRNRANGRVQRNAGGALNIDVTQSYGNCPRFIQPRCWHWQANPVKPRDTKSLVLDTDAQRWIRQADTFFIASGLTASAGENHPPLGFDASHRGGPAGFVEVLNPRQLRFDDYPGNNFFNTLGNILLQPRVGLLFVDFEQGSLLQITGRATIEWQADKRTQTDEVLHRVRVDIDALRILHHVLPLRWQPH